MVCQVAIAWRSADDLLDSRIMSMGFVLRTLVVLSFRSLIGSKRAPYAILCQVIVRMNCGRNARSNNRQSTRCCLHERAICHQSCLSCTWAIGRYRRSLTLHTVLSVLRSNLRLTSRPDPAGDEGKPVCGSAHAPSPRVTEQLY